MADHASVEPRRTLRRRDTSPRGAGAHGPHPCKGRRQRGNSRHPREKYPEPRRFRLAGRKTTYDVCGIDAHSGGNIPFAIELQSTASIACLQVATPCEETLDVRLHVLPTQQLAMKVLVQSEKLAAAPQRPMPCMQNSVTICVH